MTIETAEVAAVPCTARATDILCPTVTATVPRVKVVTVPATVVVLDPEAIVLPADPALIV